MALNPNLGGLFRGSFRGVCVCVCVCVCVGGWVGVGGGREGVNYLRLKLVRIMLATSTWHVSTQTYIVSENIFKKSAFLA